MLVICNVSVNFNLKQLIINNFNYNNSIKVILINYIWEIKYNLNFQIISFGNNNNFSPKFKV